MKRILFLVAGLFIITSGLKAQYYYERMYIHDPQGWRTTGVDITEQVYSIHERGTMVEVNQYLSFQSNNPSRFYSETQIELVCHFKLPEEIQISNLWLWVGDDIMEARIYDRWTASRIYEGIVDRRKDPALLMKEGNGQYTLRIYPFKPDQIRKIRLSYLMPSNRTDQGSSIDLPNRIQELANSIDGKPKIMYWTEAESPVLSIDQDSEISFIKNINRGNTYYSTFLPSPSATDITVRSNVFSDSVFVSTYSDSESGEKYYGISLVPSSLMSQDTNRYVVAMTDFIPGNTSMTKGELLTLLQTELKRTLSENDKFLILSSGLNVTSLSEDWITGSDSAIEQFFSDISEENIGEIANHNSLLTAGIDSLRDKEGITSSVFITASQNFSDFQEANEFLEAFMEFRSGSNVPVNVADIQTKNFFYNNQNGRSYRGNEYFNSTLSRETLGENYNYNDTNNPGERVRLAISNVAGSIQNFDLYTTIEGGFTYSRYNTNLSSSMPAGIAVNQVGKFRGAFPFRAEMTGISNGEIFIESISIEGADFVESDSTLKRFWAGRRIKEIENSNPTNEEINEAIGLSMDNRILSEYTAFLALEPSDTVEACASCFDESELVDLEDTQQPDRIEIDSLYAYPNPFNPTVTIGVELTESWNANNSSVTIYNLLGKQVARLNTSAYQGRKAFRVTWNIHEAGKNLATGVYFVRLQTPKTTQNIQITYIK